MSARRFLVLHGWENHRAVEHWQWWLVDRLRGEGEQVLYPQLPSPDEPRLADWLEVLAAEWTQMGDGERIVVTHSLSCLLWMHAALAGVPVPPADRVALVAPPSPQVMSGLPAIAEFRVAPDDRVRDAVAASSRARVRLVGSDADIYSPEGPASQVYGRALDLDCDTVPGAGHVTMDDGFGPWPAVHAWCLDPAARFGAS